SIFSVLPSGLNCLQRNFPCNRGRGTYYNFAIKCGGPQITSSDGTLFERDNETLGLASYYVTDTNRWAVSNVGYFTGSNNPQYTISSSSQFTSTLDPELFQTARVSASSIRYYGLGLENGNYTVKLQFAEIEIMDTNIWESLGRRVFDIYIQGNLVLEDFDIRKEAGGVSKRAVPKEFKAQVSENYLEIHLFWAGKGTCCVPAQGKYGPSISAISATPDFIPTVNNNAPTSKKSRTGLIVGIVVGVGAGKLDDGRVIAVKQLSIASRQGKSEFVTEIATISAVQHRNLVKLYGCCFEADQRLLAWYLHENDREVELVDGSLSEFNEEEVKRVIGIALLCTQTSPMQRPSMSRVVAMLSGDADVSRVVSKPGYLTDWKFDDTSFMSNLATRASETSYDTSTSTSIVANTENSPMDVTKPMLHSIIGEGR
ncbi:Serine-threonine/tyrosine-protein kinase, partial [Theobroma cacao]